MQATLLWMAPELFHSRFNCKADIWSLGCTIIEMATRKKPWDEQNFESMFVAMHALKKAKTGPPMPKNLSPAAQAFINRCFTRDYTLRPTATELLADGWFPPVEGSSPLSSTPSTKSNSSTSSGGSETPQGPSASTPMSTSTSVSEVKFNVGPGLVSSQPSGLVDDEDEEMKRNWVFDSPPTSSITTASATPSASATVAPTTLLSTLDFLAMQSALDDEAD